MTLMSFHGRASRPRWPESTRHTSAAAVHTPVTSSPLLLLAPQARRLFSSRGPRTPHCLNGSFARPQLQGAPLHTAFSGRPLTMPSLSCLASSSLPHPSSHAPNVARLPKQMARFARCRRRKGACLRRASISRSSCRCSASRMRNVERPLAPHPACSCVPCNPLARAPSLPVRCTRTSSRPIRHVAQEHSALRPVPQRCRAECEWVR
jgi:hypothetical protein